MILEVGKVYASPAGCPVKLLEVIYNRDELRLEVKVEYISETNNDGNGKGAISLFYGRDLREWEGELF